MLQSLTRCVPGVGLYFCSLDWLKSNFVPGQTPTALQSIALGVFARCMSGVALIPVTVVKTRFESGVYGYNSVRSALSEIYRTEGIRGMTCGLVPTLFRDAPFSGLYFMFYTQTKQIIAKGSCDFIITFYVDNNTKFLFLDYLNSSYSAPIHFTCGMTSGVLASIVTQPADVLKTKMQLYPSKFNGIWSCVIYVHSKYGFKGYFKGMVPRMLRRTLMATMAWTVYEQVSTNLGLK